MEVFLVEAFDEDSEEIDDLPIESRLDSFAATCWQFQHHVDMHIKLIQFKALERYLRLYAHYYEDPEKSGAPALNIDSVEKHDQYIKDIIYLRILDDNTIRLSIRYQIDMEHRLEFRFKNGK